MPAERPGWTTIPPWLYENDLPDDHLQALYVTAAERWVRRMVEDRDRLAEALERAEEQVLQAQALLARARQALYHYRRRPPDGP